MKEAVRRRYARSALELPEDRTPPSLGVGDPVSLARLAAGETVLDLGSGPGRDLLAAAGIVGATGRAIGVDFTPEMIERSRRSAESLGNVSILEGDLERLPVHCGAVDVVISNCVINLVDDKRRALIESFRALRPGGRLAIVDTAFESEPPREVREDPDAWSCCVGGSLVASDYAAMLADIGFEDVSVDFLDASCGEACSSNGVTARSAAVTATKPGTWEPGEVVLRPGVPSDGSRMDALLAAEALPRDRLRTQDAIVALAGTRVVGVVALERLGSASLLRSLAVDPASRGHGIGLRLVGAALEVARWSGAAEVHLLTESAQRLFAKLGFEPVSAKLTREACGQSALVSGQCCTTATAMRLDFESADLPLLSKPSVKPLPTFENGACC